MSLKMTRLERMLEAVPDALVGMDQKGVITFVNRQTESLFGHDRDDLIGQQIETLIPESLWQVYASHRDDYFADRRTRSSGLELELKGRRKEDRGGGFLVNVGISQIDTGDVLLVITAVHDVDRQKQAVQYAQLMAAVVEFSEDAIIGSTLEGIVTSWNPAAERMYGYSSREMIGRSATRLAPEGQSGEDLANLATVKNGKHVEHLETTRLRKDGSVVPVSITVAPIHDEEGAIVGASAVHRDVTEQSRAFEVAQRMEAIVESSDDSVIGHTLEGVITSWNLAAQRMYGYSSEEAVGKSVSLIIPENRSGEMEANLAKIRLGQHVERMQTIRVRKDGTSLPISLTVSPIRGPNGEISGASGISRDLTEQEHAAQYARSLIEADLDPLVTISPEGKINDVNEATVRATGRPREALLGTDFSHYFTDPDKAHDVYKRVFEQGSAIDYPLTLRHRDGTLADVLYNATVYRGPDGNVLGVFAAARDITKQKEAFEAAQQMTAIVEFSGDAIIGSTLDGAITSWNPAAERMFGYSREEIVGQSGSLITPEDRTGEAEAVMADLRAGKPVEHLETMRMRNDGTVFPVSLTVAPIRDADGEMVGLSTIARDIGDQK